MGYAQTTEFLEEGYVPSDNILCEDLTERSAISGAENLQYFNWLNIPSPYGVLRWTFELRHSSAVSGYTIITLQYYRESTSTWATVDQVITPSNDDTWLSYDETFTINWDKQARLRTRLVSFGGGTAYQRNVRFRGSNTPLVPD